MLLLHVLVAGAQGSTHARIHAVRRFHRRAKLAMFHRGTGYELYTVSGKKETKMFFIISPIKLGRVG